MAQKQRSHRNFRTTYYKTLGVPVVQHVVDVEASYHALFAESVVNAVQLGKLAREVGVPAAYRGVAWKVLLGVLPAHTSLWAMATRERRQMYDDLVAAARVLQMGTDPLSRWSEVVPSDDDEASRSDCHALLALYSTYRRDILMRSQVLLRMAQTALTVETTTDDDQVQQWRFLAAIVRALQRVLPDNDMEQFWCLVRVVDVLEHAVELQSQPITTEPVDKLTESDVEVLVMRALDCVKTATRSA